MSRVYVAALQPAAGVFGEWDWAEETEMEGCEDYLDYESVLEDTLTEADYERTHALDGRIHRQKGRVYRFKQALTESDRALGLSEGDRDTYEMVWVEEDPKNG